MGVQTHTLADFTIQIAPTRLFKALATNNHEVFPKAVPQYVQSVDIVEGNSTTVGCIKQINFSQGSPFKYVKNKYVEIDLNNLYVKHTTIEGGILGDKLEKLEYVVYESKFEASGSGCHYKLKAHYHPKGDYVVNEEELARTRDRVKKNIKAVEEYLLANPQVCA